MNGQQKEKPCLVDFKSACPLSRWRERVGVRVESKYIPLTFILSP